MNKEKTALIILHQRRSSIGDVGLKLKKRGYRIDVRKPSLGEKLPDNMDHHDVAIIYGGPMSANDNNTTIKYETDWINVALEANKPFLGICLGAQMLANNLGGTVQRATDRSHEIGFFEIIPNLEGLKIFQQQKTFFQWHNEGFTVPNSCKILAHGTKFHQQAFQYQNAYGIQFHPEVNLRMHLAWLYFAGYMLKETGAQTQIKQLNLRLKHGKKINLWLDHFLDNYLLKI
jgi:GMP synthase (glutamine-hydrolysing)